MHIGILEDDPLQRRFLTTSLKDWSDEHTCINAFERASELLTALQKQTFDLLIIDWCLPDAVGMRLVQQLRQDFGWLGPILFITASQGEDDVVMALESGADDFLTKPTRPAELRVRLSALARRADINRGMTAETLSFGAYTLAPYNHSIVLNGQTISLTPREYGLAALFLSHIGQLFSRENILELVWGISADITTRTIDTHLSRLRKKLAFNGQHGLRLKSIYQQGYRLELVD